METPALIPRPERTLTFGVGTEIGPGDLVFGQIGHEALQVLHAVIDAAEGTGRESAAPTGLGFRRAFQHQDAGTAFASSQGSAESHIATAGDDDVNRPRE